MSSIMSSRGVRRCRTIASGVWVKQGQPVDRAVGGVIDVVDEGEGVGGFDAGRDMMLY